MPAYPFCGRAAAAALAVALLGTHGLAAAHAPAPAAAAEPPAPVQVTAPLGAAPPGVTDLRFAELFRWPVGPRGLEPSERLLALQGHQVRMVGYMAQRERPLPGALVLSPLPVELGDEDEALADDLPATAVFVHLTGAAAAVALPNYRGLLQLQGRLEFGAQAEADGHVSTVRLVLDLAQSQALLPRPAAQAPSFRPSWSLR